MTLMHSGSAGFDKHLSDFLAELRVPPNYSSNFLSYYQLATGSKPQNLSCISIIENKPVAALVLTKVERKTRLRFDYFGLPGLLLSNELSEHGEYGIEEISEHLTSMGFRSMIRRETTSCDLLVSNGTISKPSRLVETLLRESESIGVLINRYRNLSRLYEAGLDFTEVKWAKPVLDALKKGIQLGIQTKVFSSQSDMRELKSQFEGLRANHLKASGRQTRPISSWEEQIKLIQRGQSFLVTAEYQGFQIAGATFVNDFNSVYYATGANDPEWGNLALGHLVQYEATKYSFDQNLDHFWIGSQFSGQTSSASAKELNIEKFKSMFGDSLRVLTRLNLK